MTGCHSSFLGLNTGCFRSTSPLPVTTALRGLRFLFVKRSRRSLSLGYQLADGLSLRIPAPPKTASAVAHPYWSALLSVRPPAAIGLSFKCRRAISDPPRWPDSRGTAIPSIVATNIRYVWGDPSTL